MPEQRSHVAWWRIAEAALEPDNLPRVLAGMGFQMRAATFARGEIAWWRPEYRGHRGWRSRHRGSPTLAGRGFRAGAFPAEAEARLDAQDERDRELVAGVNRAVRDAPVLLMVRWRDRFSPSRVDGAWCPVPPTAIYIDTRSGEWRSLCNAVRGVDLVELAALMWGGRYGRAALGVARLCGMRRVPKVPQVAARALVAADG